MNSFKFFFVLHFILPFILLVLVFFHVFFLHYYGSTNKLFLRLGVGKVEFFPYYWYKDFVNLFFILGFMVFVLKFPLHFSEKLSFEEYEKLVRPVHIAPEWYFLFAYAILRSIINKTLGVVLIILRILVFFIFLLVENYLTLADLFNKFLVILLFFLGNLLIFVGGYPAELPFTGFSLELTYFYFFLVFLIFLNYIRTKFLFG